MTARATRPPETTGMFEEPSRGYASIDRSANPTVSTRNAPAKRAGQRAVAYFDENLRPCPAEPLGSGIEQKRPAQNAASRTSREGNQKLHHGLAIVGRTAQQTRTEQVVQQDHQAAHRRCDVRQCSGVEHLVHSMPFLGPDDPRFHHQSLCA